MISEQNLADKHLVVGSLEVLKDTNSSTTKQLKKSAEALKRQTMQMFRQQSNYWNKLSDDGIITPLEKNMLKREFENIQRSYAAIYTQADTLGYLSTQVVQDYLDTYDVLHDYLYDTLKLFDDMSVESLIDDRSVFNQKFSNYYYSESFVLIAINLKIVEAIDFRVLDNLLEEGEENEIALYQGGIYMYYNGEWKSVSSGDYKGALTSIPVVQEKAFFIASDDFNSTETLYVNGEKLYVNNKELAVTRKIEKGYIYYCADGEYIRDIDRTGCRYVAAFADVINITGELPALFQASLDSLQGQINDLSDSISNVSGGLAQEIADRQGQYAVLGGDIVEINGNITGIISRLNTAEGNISGIEGDITGIEGDLSGKIDHIPVYYGARSTNPTNPKEGDWYLYNGTSTSSRLKNKVYVYRSGSWTYLAANLTENRSYYMLALKDILGGTELSDGEFDVLFANSFFADSATMDSLALREIKLRQNGVIMSDKTTYSSERDGLKIDADGNIDANGSVHIKGPVAIGAPLTGNSDFNNYDVVIGGVNGGRVKVKGHIEADSGTFGGELQAATGSFGGSLSAAAGTFYGEVKSTDFSLENHRGYRLYQQSNGVGISVLPVVKTHEISPLESNETVLIFGAGLRAAFYKKTQLRHITSWSSLFALLDNVDSFNNVICDGVISKYETYPRVHYEAYKVSSITIGKDSSNHFYVYAYGYTNDVYNSYSKTDFPSSVDSVNDTIDIIL